ncbi:MAG: ArsC/Spx/MgsR family protein [Bryobacteraceae bacterium]
MKLYLKPNCSTCRKARTFLRSIGAEWDEVDLNRGLTEPELNALIGARDYREFLNLHNELYRERKMKQNPPARAEAIRLMAQNPNLIRRPILVRGERMTLGFDEAAMTELVK